jgi:hypothetical protein
MKGYEWVEAVLAHSRAEPLDRLLLVALASRANAAGECFPSQLDLVRRTGLSTREVRYATRRLEALGELETRSGRGRRHTTLYRLAPTLAAGGATNERRHAVPVFPTRKTGTPCRGKPARGAGENRHAVPGEPDREPDREPARARARQLAGRARAEPETDEEQNTTARPLDLFHAALARLAVATGRAPPAAAATAPPAKVDANA